MVLKRLFKTYECILVVSNSVSEKNLKIILYNINDILYKTGSKKTLMNN